MRIETASLVVPAPASRVFDYLSDIHNLPKWATEFCRHMREENGRCIIQTCDPAGTELFFKIKSDRQTGVIDFWAGPTEDKLGVFPSRVIELPDQSTLYLFTQLGGPEMPDTEFDRQRESLHREFENLRRIFSKKT